METKELPKTGDVKVFFRKIRRYKFLLYILALLFLVFLLPRSGQILSKIDLFNVKQISIQTVKGDVPKNISESKLTDIASVYIGQNYFVFQSEGLRKDLIDKSAFIKEAIISKQFPSSITVEVVQREPFLIAHVDKQSCVLLDASAYTLVFVPESEDENCSGLKKEYSVPTLILNDSKVVFKENEQSSFYVSEDIWKIAKVLSEYGYQVSQLSLNDQVLIVTVNDKRTVTFSLNQSVDTQLERFIAVVGQIQLDDLDFRSLDLRYKRPVLKRK